ncbi:MAG: hypothetical protein M1822_004247 [Bathelium mastoideum]|nr:MAG: hypothetical protein M1822_004247 [Bathelium mastoideum]
MTTPEVSQTDANLWAAYGVKLKNQILESSGLGQDQRFYIAPLSSTGIAAGKNIDEAIKNMGVYNVGDALLDLDSPVFLPSRQSYSQRCQLYAGQVYLNSDGNQGAAVRYKNAQDALTSATNNFITAKTNALAAWKSDTTNSLTTDPFWTWVGTNAPAYTQAQLAMNGASADCATAAAAIQGQNAAQVGAMQNAINQAVGGNPVAGYNMTCSPASANQVQVAQAGTAGASYLQPAYLVDSSYSANVDNWISTYAQNKNNPITLNFSASQASSQTWEELGFSSSSVSVTGSYCFFFSATFTENNTTVTKNITAEQAGSDLQITLTATGLGTYKVNPGKWNPGTLWGMPVVTTADPSLSKPAAYVTQAILAYGVGLTISTNSTTAGQIQNYLQQASQTGGSASIFGYNIGLGASIDVSNTSTTGFDQVTSASSGSQVSIPPSDNAYPTLLAVIGEALPVPAPIPTSS